MDVEFCYPDINKWKIKRETAVTLMFAVFYSMPCWQWLFTQLFELTQHPEYSSVVTLALVYFPVFILLAISGKHIPADFIILFLYVVIFFCLTYVFHPEYEYVYTRNPYGVFDYVLRPDNGLYAYLFVRLVNDPKCLIRGLKISGVIVYAYSILRLYIAQARGYWIEEGARGQELHTAYNLNYGYSLLIFVCCFFYCAFEHGNILDFFLACVGCCMILCGGSRGPFLDIAVFFVLYILIRFINSKHKILFILFFGLLFWIALSVYRPLLEYVYALFEKYDIYSRTLEMLLDGDIAANNGRDTLWLAAFNMLKEFPLGYGAMGARHVLCQIHIVGHPHNFFIEILVEYGLVGGSLIIILLLFASFRILLRKKGHDMWQGAFLIFFAQCCHLLTSYTYWHSNGFWGVLGVGICIFISNHKKSNYRSECDGSGRPRKENSKEREKVL